MKNHLSRARQRVYMTQLLVLGVSFCVGLDLFGRGHVATPLWIAAGFCTFALAYAIHAKRAIQRRVRP